MMSAYSTSVWPCPRCGSRSMVRRPDHEVRPHRDSPPSLCVRVRRPERVGPPSLPVLWGSWPRLQQRHRKRGADGPPIDRPRSSLHLDLRRLSARRTAGSGGGGARQARGGRDRAASRRPERLPPPGGRRRCNSRCRRGFSSELRDDRVEELPEAARQRAERRDERDRHEAGDEHVLDERLACPAPRARRARATLILRTSLTLPVPRVSRRQRTGDRRRSADRATHQCPAIP